MTKTTFVKVHRRHILPETLDAYHPPWEWDEVSVPQNAVIEYLVKILMSARRKLYYHQAVDQCGDPK
jgi:hypothetical protein